MERSGGDRPATSGYAVERGNPKTPGTGDHRPPAGSRAAQLSRRRSRVRVPSLPLTNRLHIGLGISSWEGGRPEVERLMER